MATERTLGKARGEKLDEFYTLMEPITIELKHYKEQFKDKIIFCNCDDPYESNFFKYFAMNFNFLGLKKLIATCYNGSPVAYTQLSIFDLDEATPKEDRIAYKVEITSVEDINGDGVIDLFDVEAMLQTPGVVKKLKGNGDFRSEECIELLKEADIVVTNPPFSEFRDFINVLQKYQKSFIIIGNTNALTYKEVFTLFKEDKIRTGYTNFNSGMYFIVPDYYEKYHHIDENGKKIARVSTSCWFTNLDVKKHHDELTLFKKYSKDEYPSFFKFDAINVNSYTEIPCDYYGVMGVPITFLDKYNPNQFEIIGLGAGELGREIGIGENYSEEELSLFKSQSKAFRRGIPFYYDENNKMIVPYARIFIRRK